MNEETFISPGDPNGTHHISSQRESGAAAKHCFKICSKWAVS